MRYAKQTSVSCDKSKAEIEKILMRYGASQFVYGTKDGQAVVGFFANDRFIRFNLPLPSLDDYTKTAHGRRRRGGTEAVMKAFEQGSRQRWRALALLIKAKLESVESQITVFEDEFMAHIVLPGGITVGESIKGKIEDAYKGGKAIALLPDFSDRRKP